MSDSRSYVERLRGLYAPMLAEHGVASSRSVGWGSRRNQRLRFEVLLQALSRPARSILDVGCGVGELVAFLDERHIATEYRGIDPLPEMVAAARERFPGRRFDVALPEEAASTPPADLVLASGIFTFCDDATMRATVEAMFARCSTATAFNSLSAWATQKDDGEQYCDPLDMLAFCRTLTPFVSLRHDYLPHDFTIYLYREETA